MADIHSATAEIRRGKIRRRRRRRRRKKKPQDENIMVCPICHRATIKTVSR